MRLRSPMTFQPLMILAPWVILRVEWSITSMYTPALLIQVFHSSPIFSATIPLTQTQSAELGSTVNSPIPPSDVPSH